jgi:hypothetical protein
MRTRKMGKLNEEGKKEKGEMEVKNRAGHNFHYPWKVHCLLIRGRPHPLFTGTGLTFHFLNVNLMDESFLNLR